MKIADFGLILDNISGNRLQADEKCAIIKARKKHRKHATEKCTHNTRRVEKTGMRIILNRCIAGPAGTETGPGGDKKQEMEGKHEVH